MRVKAQKDSLSGSQVVVRGKVVKFNANIMGKNWLHVRDGTALSIWRRLGYQTAVITGRSGMAVRHRAVELGIEHVIQPASSKAVAFTELLVDLDLRASQVAVIGDDLPDLPMMSLAGYPIAVADAVPEVREAARYVTTRPGGRGAVREAIEHVLKEQHRWEEAVELYG